VGSPVVIAPLTVIGVHVGVGVGVPPGVTVGLGVGGGVGVAEGEAVGVGVGPQTAGSVSVVVTVVAPLYPPAAKRVFPMLVPATNERATFRDGPLDQVLEAGS